MPLPERADITRLLHDWAPGEAAALDRLTPQVYKELRRIAANCLRNEREGCSIQATALVHEAYLRLVTSRTSIGSGARISSSSPRHAAHPARRRPETRSRAPGRQCRQTRARPN